ncbi:MAG: indolepyruvate ferredoxin oxidoreductase subunit alpha [Methanosarcinales archaeon]|nr:MAG: indolepyruvate ferredoxin oxidoreductase subunit alpha [Methanosarcinales archaeon]
MKQMINGKTAITQAVLDSHVEHVVGVPGYPITDIMEELFNTPIQSKWCVNEKVAFESCIGASGVGKRSLVITKHVGMNILADPLITSTTHTIGAGIVVIAGDDPGAKKSQNEQDSRYYGLIAETLVFDPSTPRYIYDAIMEGYRLSEKTMAPSIVRITSRLARLKGEVKRMDCKMPATRVFDRSIWDYTLQGKHQLFHQTSYPAMIEYVENTQMNKIVKRGSTGIISSGYPSGLAEKIAEEKNISHLILNAVNPLPARHIEEFLKQHQRVLVVEEAEPFIEHQLYDRVLGKYTGHLPYGRINSEHIIHALENIHLNSVKNIIEPQKIKHRGYGVYLCSNCPFTPLYDALNDFDFPVAGDVGCSILMATEGSVDMAVSLGSAIGIALGFNNKGVAVIGDFALAHSGLQGIINAVQNDCDLLVFVICNGIAAMTGGQKAVDLKKVVASIVKDVITVDAKSATRDIYTTIINEKIVKKGVSVVFLDGACPKDASFQVIKL